MAKNFNIPHNNPSEMISYIWKVIDLPFISQNDLIYKISFTLYILPPEKAKNFIKKCLEYKFVIEDENKNLKLSNSLMNNLNKWQSRRRNEILDKYKLINESINLKSNLSNDHKSLLKIFTDKSTLNRAAVIPNSHFKLIIFDPEVGIIRSEVKGSKEDQYSIEIDVKNNVLKHNCHDFITRRAENKKFCKHILKLFLLLYEKNSTYAEFFLKNLVDNIDIWEFNS